MGCTVRDYDYIRNHMDEYQYTMALVKHEIDEFIKMSGIDIGNYPPELHKRGLEITFYKKLFDNGEMSMPKKCMRCPFHSLYLGVSGQLFDQCDISRTYTGDLLFGQRNTRPAWCPLGRK